MLERLPALPSLTSLLRRLILQVAALGPVRELATGHPAGRQVARRFVAGETLDDGVAAARRLNARGCAVSLDHLGENTTDRRTALAAAAAYLEALDRIHAE